MIQVTQVPISGKLNSDVDIQNLREGDYLDMYNVEQTNLGALTIETPVIGTESKYDLGQQLTAQNKQVRVIVPEQALINTVTDVRVRIRNLRGQLLYEGTQGILTGDLVGIKNALKAAITDSQFTATYVDIPANDFFDVTLDTAFSDYVLECTITDGGITFYDCRQVTLQENLTPEMVGTFREIAARDLIGSSDNKGCYILSTTRRVLPTEFPIINVFGVINGLINITVDGIVGFGTVIVGSVNGVQNANGVWTATPVSATPTTTTLQLNLSVFIGTYTGGGTLIANPYGLSQISHVAENPDVDVYTVTRLIKTKRLGFTTQKQPKLVGDVNINNVSLYFTDFFNTIRAIYYKGDIVQDGFLNVYNSSADYSYETIDEQTRAVSNYSGYQVELLFPQKQTSGSLTSGTKRYTVRFLTNVLTLTDSSNITQPIDVYEPLYENLDSRIFGTTGVTTKINTIRVSNILPNTFNFIELICHEYVGSATETAVTSFVVRRESLNPDQTEIELEHNGSETVVLIQTGEAVQNGLYIDKCKTLEIVNDTMVYGNISTAQEYDLTDFIETFNYSIVRQSVEVVDGDRTFGQFYDVENSHKFVGYMPYEWYRFKAVAKFKNNQTSRAFFLYDVRFVPLAEYDANEFLDTNKRDRRDTSQDQYAIHEYGNNGFTGELFQYGLRVIIPNWDILIDGIPARDLIETIYITRLECVPEVLGSGILPRTMFNQSISPIKLFPLAPSDVDIINNLSQRQLGFYCFDWIISNSPPTYIQGDTIFTIDYSSIDFNLIAPQYEVFTSSNNTDATSVESEIIEAYDLDSITPSRQLSPTVSYSINYSGGIIKPRFAYPLRLLILQDELSGAPPIRLGFYFRRRQDKYGQINQGVSFYTGAQVDSGDSSTDVFGGDTYCQKQTFKSTLSTNDSGGLGLIFFSHNRINSNLRTVDLDNIGIPFGTNTQNPLTWLETNFFDQITRNPSYTNRDSIQGNAAYNPFEPIPSSYPTRKYYSLKKPSNAIRDNFRVILPFNFNDSKNVHGAITELVNRNERLFTIQISGITVEYFDGSGRLVTSDSGEIVFGDGSAFAKTGDNLSNYGTEHQFAVVTGRTMGGKDVNYYIDTRMNVFVRSGQDGTRDLGMVVNMNEFFQTRMRFLKGKNIPTSGQGLHGAWNNRLKQVIFTARGWKDDIPEWVIFKSYVVGQVVFFQEEQEIPIFYECLVDNVADTTPIERPDLWKRIDFIDDRYYSVWTLVFSEIKNAFIHRLGIYPVIYHAHNEHLFQPDPTVNDIHRFGTGEPLVFFGQEQEGFSKRVINDIRSIAKRYIGVQYNADFKPLKMEFSATFRSEQNPQGIEITSVVNQDEFEIQENMIKASITNNFDDVTSLNDLTPVRGIFATIKTFYQPRIKQRVRELFVKLRTQLDNYKS